MSVQRRVQSTGDANAASLGELCLNLFDYAPDAPRDGRKDSANWLVGNSVAVLAEEYLNGRNEIHVHTRIVRDGPIEDDRVQRCFLFYRLYRPTTESEEVDLESPVFLGRMTPKAEGHVGNLPADQVNGAVLVLIVDRGEVPERIVESEPAKRLFALDDCPVFRLQQAKDWGRFFPIPVIGEDRHLRPSEVAPDLSVDLPVSEPEQGKLVQGMVECAPQIVSELPDEQANCDRRLRAGMGEDCVLAPIGGIIPRKGVRVIVKEPLYGQVDRFEIRFSSRQLGSRTIEQVTGHTLLQELEEGRRRALRPCLDRLGSPRCTVGGAE